jgi:hypothetical protein
VPMHVPIDVQPLGGHRLLPVGEVEALAPFLEGPSGTPDALDDASDAAIAAARDAFDQRRARVVPLELDAADARRRVAQQVDLATQLVDSVLPEPLERRVRLRHEPADRGGDRCARRVALADGDALGGERGDPERVGVSLGRQPGEEVQLESLPTLAERGLDGAEEVVLGDELVDHLAHPPAATAG